MVFKISEFGIRISVSNFEMFEPHALCPMLHSPCALRPAPVIYLEEYSWKSMQRKNMKNLD